MGGRIRNWNMIQMKITGITRIIFINEKRFYTNNLFLLSKLRAANIRIRIKTRFISIQ